MKPNPFFSMTTHPPGFVGAGEPSQSLPLLLGDLWPNPQTGLLGPTAGILQGQCIDPVLRRALLTAHPSEFKTEQQPWVRQHPLFDPLGWVRWTRPLPVGSGTRQFVDLISQTTPEGHERTLVGAGFTDGRRSAMQWDMAGHLLVFSAEDLCTVLTKIPFGSEFEMLSGLLNCIGESGQYHQESFWRARQAGHDMHCHHAPEKNQGWASGEWLHLGLLAPMGNDLFRSAIPAFTNGATVPDRDLFRQDRNSCFGFSVVEAHSQICMNPIIFLWLGNQCFAPLWWQKACFGQTEVAPPAATRPKKWLGPDLHTLTPTPTPPVLVGGLQNFWNRLLKLMGVEMTMENETAAESAATRAA